MSIVNSNPLANVTPDQGGTSAVTGIGNTGHTDTVTNTSAVDIGAGPSQNNTVQKSARWHSFGSFPAGTINSLHLKLNWDITGAVSVDSSDVGASGEATITFKIEYTLNGGGAWTEALLKTRSVSASSGSSDSDSIDENGAVDVTLMVSQDIGQVQVRTLTTANAQAIANSGSSANATASETTIISDIKLEADITLSSPAGGRRRVIVVT